MKPCPKCGEQIKDTLKFCVYCGCNIAQEEAKAKAKFCGECGAQIEDGMRFCGECGAKVDAPAKQNDDPWADVLDEKQNDDPWSNFGDSEQDDEEEIEQEPQVDLQKINDDYNKGVDLYWKQQYFDALSLLLPAAQQGNVDAQFKVGYCYDMMKQFGDAYKWYCKASEQGVGLAYNNIGWMYQNGFGVKQDYVLAYSNYKTAADIGEPLGCINAGWLLQNGLGVQQDYTKAFDYFLKAAQMNHASAQNSVGLFYHKGWGVEQNQEKAAEWLVKALQNGERQYAANNLCFVASCFWSGRDGVAKADEKRAFDLFSFAAQYDCGRAYKWLGDCYSYAWGTSNDFHKAKYWYEKARDAGEEVGDSIDWINKKLSDKNG